MQFCRGVLRMRITRLDGRYVEIHFPFGVGYPVFQPRADLEGALRACVPPLAHTGQILSFFKA